MADPVDRALLDVRERGAEELGDLHPQRLGVRADHGEDWSANGGSLLGPERPLGDGGQLDSEEGVGILDRLRDHTRDPLLEQRSTLFPIEAACGGHEHGKRARVVAASVCLEHRAGGFQERTAERQRHQRRLQQSERVHLLGVVEGQLGSDRRAGGMARDVSAPHTEVLEQRRGVGGVLSYAHRRWSVRAADPTALVVSDQLVTVVPAPALEGAARSSRR